MRRFFFTEENRRGDRVRLDADESRHLVKVLRLQPGGKVELIDGSGAVWGGTVITTERNVELQLGDRRQAEEQAGAPLYLFQALLKGEKMDLVVQKATELGARRLVPVQTARSQGGAQGGARRQQRWQRISLGACKQSLRPWLMEIAELCPPGDFRFDLPADCLKILFWEGEQQTTLRHLAADLAQQGRAGQPVALFIGPEGGITEEEVAAARTAGWRTADLGERILRAETASIAALALMGFLADGA